MVDIFDALVSGAQANRNIQPLKSSTNRTSSIVKIPPLLAVNFIKRWHYSKSASCGKNIYFGWYIDSKLYAVANYGHGGGPYIYTSIAGLTGEPVTRDDLLELKRLCRVEPKDEVYLTHFLSKCHKILKSEGCRYIISFSDPNYGHNGGIYKAANFKHIGYTEKNWHIINKKGIRQGMRHVALEEGLERIKTKPKDRWFLKL